MANRRAKMETVEIIDVWGDCVRLSNDVRRGWPVFLIERGIAFAFDQQNAHKLYDALGIFLKEATDGQDKD